MIGWCRAIGQEPHLGLNVLLTDGVRMVGSRWQRSLHYLERAGRAACPVCGRCHAAGARDGYRALLIASEPITDEAWPEVPERSVFEVTPRCASTSCPSAPPDRRGLLDRWRAVRPWSVPFWTTLARLHRELEALPERYPAPPPLPLEEALATIGSVASRPAPAALVR